jgi:hypothetical protein
MDAERTVCTIEDDQRGEISREEIDEWLLKVLDRSERVAQEQCDFFEKVTDEEFFW